MPEDFQPVQTIDGDYSKGLLLLCDHACNHLPEEYGSLGLPSAELDRHIAYDLGAEALTLGLADALGVPAVLAKFSRLLIDPNRGEDDPTLIRQIYDGTIIKSNYPLSPAERQKRIDHYFRPYHAAIDGAIERILTGGSVPAILSVHTMTDKWNGVQRPWHASILWDMDRRFVDPMLDGLRSIDGLIIGSNEPYDGALGGDTMYNHCTLRGFAHALLEVRQDLLRDGSDTEKWVGRLVPIIEKANALPHNHVRHWFGTRTGMAFEAVTT